MTTELPLEPLPRDPALEAPAKRAYSPPTVTNGRRVDVATLFEESGQLRMLTRQRPTR